LFAAKTADLIISEQTPKRLLEVRGKLYELLVHAIPPRLIIKTLTDCLVMRCDEDLRGRIVEKAAFYELRCRQGNKAIFHLEAFVAQVMAIIKSSFEGMEWD
jgi:replication factor C subunit 3/5